MMPTNRPVAAPRWGFALSEAVEALTEKGYIVLGSENAEEVATLLGSLAFGQEVEDAAWRATQVLDAFPEGVLGRE